jgi:hypothetical protein
VPSGIVAFQLSTCVSDVNASRRTQHSVTRTHSAVGANTSPPLDAVSADDDDDDDNDALGRLVLLACCTIAAAAARFDARAVAAAVRARER